MSVEIMIICDGCAGVIEAARTATRAREVIRRDWPGSLLAQPGGRDFCPDCVKAGRHLEDRRA